MGVQWPEQGNVAGAPPSSPRHISQTPISWPSDVGGECGLGSSGFTAPGQGSSPNDCKFLHFSL